MNVSESQSQLLAEQPIKTVIRDQIEYTILGTAHVSKASADAVKILIEEQDFDAVAIELCQNRFHAMHNPDNWKNMDLFQIVKQGKVGLVAANLALGAYQKRIAEQFGIEPGAEMKAAMSAAEEKSLPLLCIDRDVGITLKRVQHSLGFFERLNIVTGLFFSLFSREEVSEEEIEKLKEGDMLESTFAEFASSSEHLYGSLIDERDQFMAAALRNKAENSYQKVLVVLGAGHLKGTEKYLQENQDDPKEVLANLDQTPPPSNWLKLIPWAITLLVLSGFTVGFMRNPDLGWDLIKLWVLINGSLSALGALIAGGHPLTVVTAFFAAPLTSLNPAVGAGMVTGAVELSMRKPKVADFDQLRDDILEIRGWWRNRVSRTFLVFFLSNMGSVAGTWIAGLQIVKQLT